MKLTKREIRFLIAKISGNPFGTRDAFLKELNFTRGEQTLLFEKLKRWYDDE